MLVRSARSLAKPVDIAVEIPCSGPNRVPAHVAGIRESPFRRTLFLKLHSPPASPDDYDLTLELDRGAGEQFHGAPQPWQVELDPARLFLVRDEG